MSLAIISITNSCNLCCKMCDIGLKNKEGSIAKNLLSDNCIDASEWLNILRRIKAKKVHIIGVEPLLYNQLEELLINIKKMGLHLSLTTNAWAFEKNKNIVAKYCDVIWISIDGYNAETHDYNRGVSGSHTRAMKALRFLQGKNKNVCVSFCILPNNINEICRLNEDMVKTKTPIVFNHFNFIKTESCEGLCAQPSNLSYINLSEFNIDNIYKAYIQCKHNAIFSPNLKTKNKIYKYYNEIPKHNKCVDRGCKIIEQLCAGERYVISASGNLLLGNRCWMEYSLGNVLDFLKSPKKQKQIQKIANSIRKKGFPPPCQRLCCGGDLV